jgi:hypothetical protein
VPRFPDDRTMTRKLAAAAGFAALAGLCGPAAAQQPPGPPVVSVKTIDGDCKIGEGGAGLYRNASEQHQSCGLYPAPVGSVVMVVDESGSGVDIKAANRGAKLNSPDGTAATCGRGSVLLLTVITMTTDTDGFQRADYNAACIPGPFPR